MSYNEHRRACEVCLRAGLCDAPLVAEARGRHGTTLGLSVRELGAVRSTFALVLAAIQKEAGARAHTLPQALRQTDEAAAVVMELLCC